MSKHVHEKMLCELTGLATAAGCEDRVIAWVEQWAAARPTVRLERDRFGNIMLARKGKARGKPIVLEAHMDHPAFVITGVIDGRRVAAEFRGGVQDSYFKGASVCWLSGDDVAVVGKITAFEPISKKRRFRQVVVTFDEDVAAQAGDVMMWRLPGPRMEAGRLFAPACDDLAAVAAALAVFDTVNRKRLKQRPDVRVLLTRAEEVGFIGAMGACRSGIIPAAARIIALENSKSYVESPIGGGPIVRVGDRLSIFNHHLTYAIDRIAEGLAGRDKTFRWQRKLMPGGSCEAGAFQELGYVAACLCLPLGNYHNMNERIRRIDSEIISIADYHGLIRLLVAVVTQLDDVKKAPTFKARLDELFEQRCDLIA